MERKTGLKRRGENCQDQHTKGGIHHHKESTRGFCQPQNISEEGVSTFIVPRRSFRKEPEFLHRQFLLIFARRSSAVLLLFLVAFLVCMAKTPSERRKKHVYFLERICAAAFHHLSFAKGEEEARGGSSFCKNLTNWINLTAPLIGNLH